jgi:hypothetical protein
LCDDAFKTDSDEDTVEFYEGYLGQQGSGTHTPQGSAAQMPKPQAGSTALKQQPQQQGLMLVTPAQPSQQQQQGVEQVHPLQQQQRQEGVQELTGVAVQDDPLSNVAPAAAAVADPGASSKNTRDADVSPAARQQSGQHQAQAADDAATNAELVTQQPDSSASLGIAAAAAAAGTAAGKGPTAAAAGCSSSSGAAASSGAFGGMFTRKAAPPPPVYVALLPTPVNPKHKDETRIALTIAVNGCCIESMEDFVKLWQHLPSGDCDR